MDSKNIHSIVLETGEYKDCTLMAMIKTVAWYKTKGRNVRSRRHCVMGTERKSFLFSWRKMRRL